MHVIDPTRWYSTKDIADLAGRADEKGLKSVSQLLKNHNKGQLIAGRRLFQGAEVQEALEIVRNAKPGNPWNRRVEAAPAVSDTDRKPAKKRKGKPSP